MALYLVTGASGAFGAHAAKMLLALGHRVVSFEHDSHPFDTASLLGIKEHITWVRGSLLDETLCKRVVADYSPDSIWNFAALPIVQAATRTTVPIFDTNVMGTVHLLEAVKENNWAGKKIRFIQVSTDKVYGDAGEVPYTEDMPLNGLSVYDASKACADIIARTYAHVGYAPALATVRPCNTISPGDMNLGRVLTRILVPCMRGESPTLYRTPYKREYMWVEDSVGWMYLLDRALAEGRAHGEAYNIGSGEQRTLEGAVEEVLEHFPGITPKWIEPPPISRLEIPYQKLDTTKFKSLVGLGSPPRAFSGSVKGLVAWWRANWDRLPASVKTLKIEGWH